MYKFHNSNPQRNSVGDCVVRAISKILGYSWAKTYIELCIQGFMMCNMPSANSVWGAYLRNKGFKCHMIPEKSEFYTVEDFANDNPKGEYILATGAHVIAVSDGIIYDTWNSSDEIPTCFWKKED